MDRLKYKLTMTEIITDDTKRIRFQSELIYCVFAFIAFVMSVINILTHQTPLLIATGVFCLLCVANLLMTVKSAKLQSAASYLFMAEVIGLFTYFIVTGGTGNFSIVWLLLLPTVGLLFFGRLMGSILCGIILVIMLVCFYPLRAHITNYGSTWFVRFPVVFVCSYCVSFVLETVRYVTARELNLMREKYHHLSRHDALTGVLNRYGMEETLNALSAAGADSLGVLIFDIDRFKQVNDSYGHMAGDLVLKELAGYIAGMLPRQSSIFRWGGEEFAVLYTDVNAAEGSAQQIVENVRSHVFHIPEGDIRVTVSLGLVISKGKKLCEKFGELMQAADKCLYRAKQKGRDRVETDRIEL